ncbi:MAG: 2,3-bisphosphoglycerate-independent phosphoglycerate mutase [Prevotellaceae bacterium]|nr:2,3-bisphosphoglycerate-independent phosphoglycerate mutase [Prevotellaceae bacterium]
MHKKVLLMILDGWGEGKHDLSNAIFSAGAPHIDALRAKYPYSFLSASGQDVGLPEGQMGNSEVGHLNIGAGRVVYQDLVKINRACSDGSIGENPQVKLVYEYVQKSGKQLHLLGLTSEGGVHSAMDHLYAFCDLGKAYQLDKLFIHCFMDGRDTDPRSGKGYLQKLQNHLAHSVGKIASVTGRYYAMDRDKRWERIKEAYDLLTAGKGAPHSDPITGIQESYENGVTDEFIKPIVCVDNRDMPIATIQEGDAVIFFNFRNDRARELTQVLTQSNMPDLGMKTIPLYYCCLTPYDDKFKGLHILFDKEKVQRTLGEVISTAGCKQLRIAETEKYAHVTFFFSGGREEVFTGEDRILINSPKTFPTYDLQPEMSAFGVKDAVIEALRSEQYDSIILNFANGDMVGHTGVYEAICDAVKTVNICVHQVVRTAREHGYTVLITADHGNADFAVNPDGSPNTAHSMNKVPFIVVDDDIKMVKDGILADIAPTILTLMGIEAPIEMTGKILV